MPSGLDILVISDLRTQPINRLVQWVSSREPRPDLVIYAGDDVERFRPDRFTNHWEELARCSKYGVVAVAGNDDDPTFVPPIRGTRVFDLGDGPVLLGPFAIVGVPGAEILTGEPNPGYLLRTRNAIAMDLGRQRRRIRGKTIILVSHAPPHGVLDLALRFSRDGTTHHIGSHAVAALVNTDKAVRLVVCGHAHLSGACHEQIGKTTVVNAASHDDWNATTRVGELRFTQRGVRTIRWHELKHKGGFEGVAEVGWRRAQIFEGAGIPNALALANASPAAVGTALGYRPHKAVPFIAAARSLITQQAVLHSELKIPTGPRLFIDIETDLGQRQVWVIGVYDEGADQFRSFVARREKDEVGMLEQFGEYVTLHQQPIISYSGSRFDERVLRTRYETFRLASPVALAGAVDAMLLFKKSIALPCEWRMKKVARWSGFRFRHPDLDGRRIGSMCGEYRQREVPPPRRVLEYNEDDARAVHHIVSHLERLLLTLPPAPEEWRPPARRALRSGQRRNPITADCLAVTPMRRNLG